VREGLRALLAAWHRQFGNCRATIKAAIEAAAKATDLQTAMEAVAGEKGGINARRLGRFIAKHERRIEGGLRFVKDGSDARALFWRTEGELGEFNKFFSAPSREEETDRSRSGHRTQIDQWGTNSPNSPPPDPIEVEL
jgi:hypothetical protein